MSQQAQFIDPPLLASPLDRESEMDQYRARVTSEYSRTEGNELAHYQCLQNRQKELFLQRLLGSVRSVRLPFVEFLELVLLFSLPVLVEANALANL
jgi:hypothetical protein